MTETIIKVTKEGKYALNGSIQKWEKITFAIAKSIRETGSELEAEYDENGYQDCPLCKLYHPRMKGKGCSSDCPIKKDTGCDFCEGTAYDDWNDDFDSANRMYAYLIELYMNSVVEE